MRITASILFLCLVVFSCRKKEEKVQALATISVSKSVRLNDLKIVDDTTWIACGGQRDIEGYIFKTLDGGTTWSLYSSEFQKSIYCLDFPTKDIGMAGGDFLHLWQTNDGGATWNFIWLADQVPFNGEDRPAVRDIKMRTPFDWYFCGGENLGEGVIYETHDGGDSWNFSFQQHELSTIELTQNGDMIVGGHGAVFTFSDSLSSLHQTNFENDFIKSCANLDSDECVAVSYDGAIYRSSDNGENWNEVVDANKTLSSRVNWNKVEWSGNKLIAVGNAGHFAASNDGGYTWSHFQLEQEPNLYSIAFRNEEAWATSDNGKIYRIQ